MAGDKAVVGLVVGGNTGPEGGIILKLAIADGASTETLTLLRPAGQALADAMIAAQKAGRLPPITPSEIAALLKRAPAIEDYDWNLQSQHSRIVSALTVAGADGGFVFTFVTRGGLTRRYHLPTAMARLMTDTMYGLRSCLDDPPR